MKTIYKNRQKKCKTCFNNEVEEYKYHQYKNSISNKFPFSKQDSKYFLGYKDNKRWGLYAYPFQKWVYVKDILIKLYVCIL